VDEVWQALTYLVGGCALLAAGIIALAGVRDVIRLVGGIAALITGLVCLGQLLR
jgi:hypothetical protein